MKVVGDKQMKRWIAEHVDIRLDMLSQEDAGKWLALAQEETWRFFKLAEHGLRLSRMRHLLPPPASRREVTAFLLEFRTKIQVVHDQFPRLPQVRLFDFGGEAFIYSDAFRRFALMYNNVGGRA